MAKEDIETASFINVQCLLEPDYYDRLNARAKANDRSARREATRILKAVIDGDVQFVDPRPAVTATTTAPMAAAVAAAVPAEGGAE